MPESHVLGTPGRGWELVTGELENERSGPERFLSVFPLLADALDAMPGEDTGCSTTQIGRLLTHLGVLRQMSVSIADRLGGDASVSLEAAVAKDLGNALEREIPEVLRGFGGILPATGGGHVNGMLKDVLLAAPSFTLRGGTPEVLRSIIARGLGMR